MKRFSIATTAILFGLVPATAQEMIKGVYSRSQEQCDAARKDFQAFIETGEVVMTHRGFEGIEYNCEFIDWKNATRSPGAIVIALCEEPGFAYPQVFAFMPRGEGEIEVTLSLAENADESAANPGLYYLCEGVTMP
jgi:hypothetical protein